ncbi:MAG: hypothetical protein ACOXZU_09740 [Bacteroidales bacterium]
MTLDDIEETRYDIVRIPFDPETAGFGKTEMVFNASLKREKRILPQDIPRRQIPGDYTA